MPRGRKPRMLGVAILFSALLALIVGRAVDLTVLRGPDFVRRADGQHTEEVTLVPERGPIVDRNGEALALSVKVPSIFVHPRQFAGQEARLPELAAALGVTPRRLRARFDATRRFIWLERHASPRHAEAVEHLGLRGVGTLLEGRRFYPHEALAAHVLGFVGTDGGLEGLEGRFDRMIRGEAQTLEVYRDAYRRAIYKAGVHAGPTEGSRLEVTIDAGLQAITERELASGVAAARAAGGAAIVLDPWTGEVLALANVPTYNPNEPGDGRERRWRDRIRNRALTDPYEPGSTFKAVLAAAALQERIVTPNEMIFCENGRYPVGRWTLHDSHPHGWLSFAEVIQYSSNIGAAKVGERLGRDRYFRHLRDFGFGERTGIELPGETPGILRPVDSWARIDLLTHSFGQGVSVTPIQMAVAFAAIANGGTLMRPWVVRRITSPTGAVLLENEPRPERRVVSPEVARVTTELLRRVVEEKGGTGAKARLDDFSVAGKTGTAQKVDPRTGGYSSKRIGSFVGFVPADGPRLVILVLIDEPGTSSYGGVVAAPVFRSIATAALKQLGVQPAVEMAAAVPPAAAAPPAATVPPPEAAASGTPSFLGLSMREALSRAQDAGWTVRVRGSGWVAMQDPPPGTPLGSDRRLALELRADAATARP
jgi:cell division protein FtsI (penicillin-binding protein 3)